MNTVNKIISVKRCAQFWRLKQTLDMSGMFPYLFLFLFGYTHETWRFLGQGSNLSHSSDLSSCSDNAKSITHGATRELHLFLLETSAASGTEQEVCSRRRKHWYFRQKNLGGAISVFLGSGLLHPWGKWSFCEKHLMRLLFQGGRSWELCGPGTTGIQRTRSGATV